MLKIYGGYLSDEASCLISKKNKSGGEKGYKRMIEGLIYHGIMQE